MIRSATINDASRLAEILIFAKRTAYREIFQNDHVSFHEMQVLDLALHYQQTPKALEELYVYDDGIVKGMMRLVKPISSDIGFIWELKELYIDTFFQGQGIGEKLMLHLLANAKENHAAMVRLWVLEKNIAARKFYEAHGFWVDGRKQLEAGTTEYLIGYEKKLTDGGIINEDV